MGGKGSGPQGGSSNRALAPCGTQAAYQRHRKKGESCRLCMNAAAAAKRRTYKPKVRTAATRDEKRRFVLAAKIKAGSCVECGLKCNEHNTIKFEWDHIDPTQKAFALSRHGNHSIAEIIVELAKCRLMCSNCHQAHTYQQRHYAKPESPDKQAVHQATLFNPEDYEDCA